ncbi:MAG: retention module-containing protein, partial [Sedimenticola sp.]|nr:retention module-containing protein [Sedimenticola sp.]
MADSNTQDNSSAIGYVKLMNGLVKAVDINGIERVLQIGDAVFADETIVTGPQAAVVIELRDGSSMSMGGESQALLNDEVYDPSVAEDVADRASTIDAVQQAILAGADPTDLLEATAAGAGDATVGDGNQGQVAVERTGDERTPESGFETTGLNRSFEEIPDEEGAALEPEETDVTVSPPPTVTIPNDGTGTGGSDNSVPEDSTVSGSFAITAPDGLQSITVGGTVITAAQLAASGTTSIVIAGAN